jgi:EpsI family protein
VTVSRATSEGSLRAPLVSVDAWEAWYAPAVFVGIVLATAALFWTSTWSLLHEWFFDETSFYGHGPLIILVGSFLAIRALRAEPVRGIPEKSVVWCALLVMSSFLWLIAVRSGIQLAHQLLLPIFVWISVRILLGSRAATLTLVPIALFYSAIPLWHISIPTLQGMTVSVVGTLLRIVGVPAFAEGEFVYIPNGVFQVEQGCSGLRYFVVGVTIAGVLGEIRSDSWRTRIGLVALAAAFSLAANWVRVFVVVYAGYLTDMQHYLVRVEHVRFGWVVFMAAMALFLFVVRRWMTAPAPIAAPVAPAGAPPSRRSRLSALALTLSALLVGPVWSWVAPVRDAAGLNVTLPQSIGAWVSQRDGCSVRWQPQFPGADGETKREYVHGSSSVCVYVATYLSQHQEKELIGYYSRIHDASSEVIARGSGAVGGQQFNEIRLAGRAGADRLLWYTYVVGDRAMRRGIEAQLRYALGTLYGAPASSVLALSAPCKADCNAAREALTEVVSQFR